MALKDLVKPLENSLANDRELYGDQTDMKINDLRKDVRAVCDAIETGTFTGTLGGKALDTSVSAPLDGAIIKYDGSVEKYKAVVPVDAYTSIRAGSGLTADVIGAATKYLDNPGKATVAASYVIIGLATFSGTAKNLVATLNVAPGLGENVSFTLYKSSDQGSTWTATTLTITIADSAKINIDSTNTPAISLGEMLAIQVVSSAGVAAGPMATFVLTV